MRAISLRPRAFQEPLPRPSPRAGAPTRGAAARQATQAHAERSRRRAAENLAAAVAGVAALEAELEAAGGRFAYLQQLRAYVADLCDMLQVCHACI